MILHSCKLGTLNFILWITKKKDDFRIPLPNSLVLSQVQWSFPIHSKLHYAVTETKTAFKKCKHSKKVYNTFTKSNYLKELWERLLVFSVQLFNVMEIKSKTEHCSWKDIKKNIKVHLNACYSVSLTVFFRISESVSELPLWWIYPKVKVTSRPSGQGRVG